MGLIRSSLICIKWLIVRLRFLWVFLKMARHAREMELEMQGYRQARNNFEYAGPNKREEFFYMKGFCAGIDYCIKKYGNRI